MEIKQNYVIWILIALLFIFITEDFFEDISNDVEAWYDTSNCDKNDKRLLPIDKNKKVIGLFKDKLGERIIKNFAHLELKHIDI